MSNTENEEKEKMNMEILNPRPFGFNRPQYESYATNEVIGHTYEFGSWEDDVTDQICRALERVNPSGLPQLPPEILGRDETEHERTARWLIGKRSEHMAYMLHVLGRPETEQEAIEVAQRFQSN